MNVYSTTGRATHNAILPDERAIRDEFIIQEDFTSINIVDLSIVDQNMTTDINPNDNIKFEDSTILITAIDNIKPIQQRLAKINPKKVICPLTVY